MTKASDSAGQPSSPGANPHRSPGSACRVRKPERPPPTRFLAQRNAARRSPPFAGPLTLKQPVASKVEFRLPARPGPPLLASPSRAVRHYAAKPLARPARPPRNAPRLTPSTFPHQRASSQSLFQLRQYFRLYPCRSMESAIKLVERSIAGVTEPARPSTPEAETNPHHYDGPPRTAEQVAA